MRIRYSTLKYQYTRFSPLCDPFLTSRFNVGSTTHNSLANEPAPDPQPCRRGLAAWVCAAARGLFRTSSSVATASSVC